MNKSVLLRYSYFWRLIGAWDRSGRERHPAVVVVGALVFFAVFRTIGEAQAGEGPSASGTTARLGSPVHFSLSSSSSGSSDAEFSVPQPGHAPAEALGFLPERGTQRQPQDSAGTQGSRYFYIRNGGTVTRFLRSHLRLQWSGGPSDFSATLDHLEQKDGVFATHGGDGDGDGAQGFSSKNPFDLNLGQSKLAGYLLLLFD